MTSSSPFVSNEGPIVLRLVTATRALSRSFESRPTTAVISGRFCFFCSVATHVPSSRKLFPASASFSSRAASFAERKRAFAASSGETVFALSGCLTSCLVPLHRCNWRPARRRGRALVCILPRFSSASPQTEITAPAAARSASSSRPSVDGPPLVSGVAAELPVPCCTTWASSCASSASPTGVPGLYSPEPKAMSDPIVNARALRLLDN